MCLGYIGTLTSQTFQHVDSMHNLSKALLSMNELYGSNLLVNGTMYQLLETSTLKTPVCGRRIDRIVLCSALQQLATRQIEFFRRRAEIIEEMRVLHVSGGDTQIAAAELEDLERGFRRGATNDLGESVEHDVVELLTTNLDHDVRDLEVFLDDVGEAILDQYSMINTTQSSGTVPRQHNPTATGVNAVTAEAAARFDKAFGKMLAHRDPSDLMIYAKSMTYDHVAQAVARWARWMNAVNEAEGIAFPRPIVLLGAQLHRCETDARLVPRGNRDAFGELLGLAVSERKEARKKQLRPARSERRLRDSRRPPPVPVLERIIGVDKFNVTFEPRSDDGPIVDV